MTTTSLQKGNGKLWKENWSVRPKGEAFKDDQWNLHVYDASPAPGQQFSLWLCLPCSLWRLGLDELGIFGESGLAIFGNLGEWDAMTFASLWLRQPGLPQPVQPSVMVPVACLYGRPSQWLAFGMFVLQYFPDHSWYSTVDVLFRFY